MNLFERRKPARTIYVSAQEDSAVQIAAENLASDIEKICGVRPALTRNIQNACIVLGTAANLSLPNGIRLSAIQQSDDSFYWEGYIQQMHEGVLYLVGSDRRGAIYAGYDFSERIGMSAWHYFADVPCKQRDIISLPDDYFKADWPSVHYRGIFLNDEEELEHWVSTNGEEKTIGPITYQRIFELILRLKGNLIWPAMHVNAFNIDPENGRLAQRMGLITGTSHCDMLHRSNQNEWNYWLSSKGYTNTEYDYTIPGENRRRLMEYWRESLIQNQDFDCCYTLGMRGIHDSGFVTQQLNAESLSEQELMDRKRELLEEIIRAQRSLINEIHPHEAVPQVFVPYKEVLPIYDSGLAIPDDVCLIWVDDNHGYVRRYPDISEQRRTGGNGLYYHSSYWSPPGLSYLFLGSPPLAHMGNELKKCWEQGIRRLWVNNVGALKPLEQELEFFLRCGWDAGKPNCTMTNSRRFTAEWIDRNFSGEHGQEVSGLYAEYAQLNNLCKPEHMRSNVFSQYAYGDEAASRINRLLAITQKTEAIYDALPENEKAAFFQLMLMKMKATLFIAASYYHADRSILAYRLGAMRSADMHLQKSRETDDLKRKLLHYYNEVMSGGKWRNILTPEDFPPPTLELNPACRPSLSVGTGTIALQFPSFGERDTLLFSDHQDVRWLDLFNCSDSDVPFSVIASNGIQLSSHCGILLDETRIFVKITSSFREGQIVLSSKDAIFTIPVRISDMLPIHLSADAAFASNGFRHITDMGRAYGNAVEAAPDACIQSPAVLQYAFTTSQPCAPLLEIIRFLTLNSTGHIRIRATIDGAPAVYIDSPTIDEHLGDWKNAVLYNGEKLTAQLPEIPSGKHVLTLEALDPYITICACNLYMQPREKSLLGPDAFGTDIHPLSLDIQEQGHLFSLSDDEIPLPYTVYCGDRFWTQNMLYARNERVRPRHYGAKKDWQDSNGRRNIIACLPKGPAIIQNGRLGIEVENALANSRSAWMTSSANGCSWIQRQAETNRRTGLALYVPADCWKAHDQCNGPMLFYRIFCDCEADYNVWFLAKYDDEYGMRYRFYLDGERVRAIDGFRDDFHCYRNAFMWCWMKLLTVHLREGEHIIAIEARTPNMAIDRIYLTNSSENPPTDDCWTYV